MPFTIPDVQEAPYPQLAALDQTDIDALIAGQANTGVTSGCAVTAQGTPDMTVAVAAGWVIVDNKEVAVTAGNLTIGAAHASLGRRDIVVADNAGTKAIVAGTASAEPVKPAIPANSVLIAEVFVPATDTDIDSDQIVDKRVIVGTVNAVSVMMWSVD